MLLSIHFLMNGYERFFYLSAIENNAGVNIHAQVCLLLTPVFSSFRQIAGSGTTETSF